jgi:D-alanine-D-alanine ligase
MPGRSLVVAVIYNPVELGGDAVVGSVIDGAHEAHDTITALGHRATLLRVDQGVRPFIETIEHLQPDVVFNLCEGFRESSAGEFGIAALLDLLEVPYTGSGSLALAVALNKPLSKALFVARGIPTPAFAVSEAMPEQMPALKFPWMLKLAAEDASLGITAENVVADKASAVRRLQQLFEEYRAPVLVEEFIDGREFTVPLLDGRPLLVEEIEFDPVEFNAAPRIVGFRAKWDAGSAEYRGTRPVFTPRIDDVAREQMLRLAVDVAQAIGLRDYARVDFRMDVGGRLFVLEANPNPDISRGSGYRKALDAAGISYPQFIATLLEKAASRTVRGAR